VASPPALTQELPAAMNSRVILNFVLLAVVVGLILVVYFQPGVEKAPKPPSLLSLTPEEVNHIALMPATRDAIKFEKQGSEWHIVAPVAARANAVRINTLLQLTHAAVRKSYDVARADLEKFKLDKPLGVIQFNDVKIAFGDVESLNHYRYVMVGDKVYLITDNYFYNLQSGIANYIDTRLLPPDSHIVSIEFPDMVVKGGDKGAWSVTPEHPEASADAVQTLVDAWREAQALRVSPYQGDKAQGSVKITFAKQEQPLTFEILSRDPELILGRADIGMRYHISDEQAESLMQLAKKEPPPQQHDSTTK
jgi:Domain of unknown function (DUF4340)